MGTSPSDTPNQLTMESQNRQGHLFPAYRNERVCHRWLGIMGVESSPEWKWVNLHNSSQNRWKQACSPGTQVCTARSSSPTAVLWEIWERSDGVRRAAGLCSSPLTVCSSHALPPQWLLRCSASPLTSVLYTHSLLHNSTPTTYSLPRMLARAHPCRLLFPACTASNNKHDTK